MYSCLPPGEAKEQLQSSSSISKRYGACFCHAEEVMTPLQLVMLPPLMERTSGSPDVKIGLIDGPVLTHHPDLASDHLREIPGKTNVTCTQTQSMACQHGTYVAGILSARRGTAAPGICPSCTLLVRPIFGETASAGDDLPHAKPDVLASAILDCIRAGAKVLNLSAAIALPSSKAEPTLTEALNEAARRHVIVVAAAGNQGLIGSTAITQHPWVIPVVAFDSLGRPLELSNFSHSISRRGLGAPGDQVVSLNVTGSTRTSGGTSAAAPFVTGTIALLWSQVPTASAAQIRFAVTSLTTPRRPSVVPPLLNAQAAYHALLTITERR